MSSGAKNFVSRVLPPASSLTVRSGYTFLVLAAVALLSAFFEPQPVPVQNVAGPGTVKLNGVSLDMDMDDVERIWDVKSRFRFGPRFTLSPEPEGSPYPKVSATWRIGGMRHVDGDTLEIDSLPIIRKGDSEERVVAILGEPNMPERVSPCGYSVFRTLRYRRWGVVINIEFLDFDSLETNDADRAKLLQEARGVQFIGMHPARCEKFQPIDSIDYIVFFAEHDVPKLARRLWGQAP